VVERNLVFQLAVVWTGLLLPFLAPTGDRLSYIGASVKARSGAEDGWAADSKLGGGFPHRPHV
jgi:hypothetical protein